MTHILSLRDKHPICKETKLTPRYKRIVHFFDQPAIRINQKHIRQGVSGKKNTNILATYFVCLQKMRTFATQNRAGCSSARLEYASGGRVVAGSNPVIPTEGKP